MSTRRGPNPLRINVGTGDERRQLTANAGEEISVAPSLGWVVIALDSSSSMAGEKHALSVEGVTRFVHDAIARHYSIELVPFDSKAWIACHFTREPQRIGAALKRVKPDGTTNGRDAMMRSRAELERRPGARSIVVFTDGYFDDPDGAIREADRAKHIGIDVITIGTQDADSLVLRAMASRDELARVVPDAGIADAIEDAALLLPPTV